MSRTRKTRYVLKSATGELYQKGGKVWDSTSPALAAAMAIVVTKEKGQPFTSSPFLGIPRP